MHRTGALVFALVAFTVPVFAFPAGCSSNDPPVTPSDDAAGDTVADIPPFEEPTFDSDDPAGRVLILPIYDPSKRCFGPATEIGHYTSDDAGKIAECPAVPVCYVRPDGILAYHDKDCVSAGNFRANWKRLDYSDLGPCEPIKRLRDSLVIKECPNTSCTFARDVIIDSAAKCATAITSKGCRETFGAPTACFCDGSGKVFVAANPKAPTAPPPSFTPCDSSSECKAALAMVDTVKGCATTSTDAGSDAADAGSD